MIPDLDELKTLGFRDLVDRLSRIRTGELAALDPDVLADGEWTLTSEQFRGGLIAHCRDLGEAEWRRCDEVAGRLFGWVEAFGGTSHLSVTADRFHLSASLLLEVGPRPGLALLSPGRLLGDFIAELPCSAAEARSTVSRWRGEPDGAEVRWLLAPMVLAGQLDRIEHLLPASADRDTYREWKNLWQNLT
ncbi:hypothetical protein SAMN05421837_108371 [Amycolatopsis pretoriensis]|uniref:Uncharacterized protein n=1 Tax=Amycolatopsis pretoriensis TaxID=218821 RepID=A0A1H5RBK0_9PSEU|nr:hypothetical protein [Amycolatopsis pretoriensis]SEF35776.1 hypothetical protein SAMN05421837_108371 [Amycolatopsis pretoriensis]